MLKAAKIVVLPGDGIGPEVAAAAVRVLKAVTGSSGLQLELAEGWIGGSALDRCGEPLDPKSLDLCREADAIFLGAVGGPQWEHLPGPKRPEAGLLRLRKELGVFANLRPFRSRPSLYARTPYRDEVLAGVDTILVRELTGGIYFGAKGSDGEKAFDECVYTRTEIERITRVAGQLARARGKKLCSIDKANVMETSRLWRKTVTELMASEFPDVAVQHILVDAAAMYLAQKPARFDVILTENMFGDILSDQASTLAGSLGLLPSASLSAEGPGLYEPVHGSAPDIAGTGRANPVGAILSMALLLRHSLKAEVLAQQLEAAVERVLADGPWTAEIAPHAFASTHEVTEAILGALKV